MIKVTDTIRMIDAPRFVIIERFVSNAFGCNIGCQEVSFTNKINLDVSKDRSAPNILGSVVQLPFADNSFDEIVFTEVLEHTPKDTEVQSLTEIARVLKPNGKLIMSVPNELRIAKLLDFVYWTNGHRHYSKQQIERFISQTKLHILASFSAGMIPFGVVTFPYMINWMLRRRQCDILSKQVKKAYSTGSLGNCGGTLFVIAQKRS